MAGSTSMWSKEMHKGTFPTWLRAVSCRTQLAVDLVHLVLKISKTSEPRFGYVLHKSLDIFRRTSFRSCWAVEAAAGGLKFSPLACSNSHLDTHSIWSKLIFDFYTKTLQAPPSRMIRIVTMHDHVVWYQRYKEIIPTFYWKRLDWLKWVSFINAWDGRWLKWNDTWKS